MSRVDQNLPVLRAGRSSTGSIRTTKRSEYTPHCETSAHHGYGAGFDGPSPGVDTKGTPLSRGGPVGRRYVAAGSGPLQPHPGRDCVTLEHLSFGDCAGRWCDPPRPVLREMLVG